MQIESIVLYAHDGRVRRLDFRIGELNIVSGPSGRGKSAILSIIDYCLGATRLGVPAGVIEASVAWFGLFIRFNDERIFIARRGVASGGKTPAGFHFSAPEERAPPTMDHLADTFSRQDILDRISIRLGMGHTAIPRADGTAERKELSFRSGLIYCFQKQNEIANPDLFFHRQGEVGISQTIRDTLPYYLGAISPSIIQAVTTLRAKRRRLRDVERALELRSTAIAHKDRELSFLLEEAARLDLITRAEVASGSAELLSSRLLEVTPSSSEASEDRSEVSSRLTQEISHTTRQRTDIQKELDALNRLQGHQGAVDAGLNEQKRRLSALDLVPSGFELQVCPLCEATHGQLPPSADAMRKTFEDLQIELGLVTADQVDLTHLITQKQETRRSLDARLKELRAVVSRLGEEDAAAGAFLEQRNEQARLAGMVEMFQRVITKSDRPDENASLAAEKANLIAEIEALEEETDLANVRSRTATFLGAIGQNITRWARDENLEYADGFLTFDVRGPRLVSETEAGQIPFSRFGSGKNWVWYHLLGHLALHDWFLRNGRPVPHFLVLDQPSQVYFPTSDGSGEERDWGEVRRIYRWLADQVARFEGGLQVIVADHARFSDDPSFSKHLVHDWWDGDGALVPGDWL